jgi:hypothetical protein
MPVYLASSLAQASSTASPKQSLTAELARHTSRVGTSELLPEGATQIRIVLTQPLQTTAIVIRKVGLEREVCVTVLEIGLFEAGDETLAPRSHDLGFDLFVILSAPKTGTQTIESALYALSPFARMHRVHYASQAGTRWLRVAFASACAVVLGPKHKIVRSNNFEAEAGDQARTDIATVRRLGRQHRVLHRHS